MRVYILVLSNLKYHVLVGPIHIKALLYFPEKILLQTTKKIIFFLISDKTTNYLNLAEQVDKFKFDAVLK